MIKITLPGITTLPRRGRLRPLLLLLLREEDVIIDESRLIVAVDWRGRVDEGAGGP